MAGRRKIYGSSSLPRYRVKMFDYISKGGRIPMQLAMEAVDAMGDAWSGGFFSYKTFRDLAIARAFEDHPDIPHIYAGLAKGLLMHIMKLVRDRGYTYDEALARVLDEHNIAGGDPVATLLESAVRHLTKLEKERGASAPKG